MTEPVDLPSKDEIEAFWRWFAGIAPGLAASLFDSVDHAEFDRRVKALDAGLVWELGPGQSEEYALVVSPGGRRPLLEVSQLVASLAPMIKGWEIHGAKPPKQWTERIMRFRSGGPDVEWDEINFDRWRYALVAWNNFEFFDVTFIAPAKPALEAPQLEHAAWQLLDGEFGERGAMELFAEVKVVTKDTWDPNDPIGEVPMMREHVEGLVANRAAGDT